ncbi:Leucine-rich repeat protein kinase family protein [Hibiscus syriacus]|uniref:Leucine-rich repeat protein kinase family protein n=1 Tax=Hibiscus syriacus TaxID=106335 RepID=A0A6A2ZGX4_HIBSY|nr:Leucine-rich repeat protein kinase family protein [Hibiscus syriacus]
MMIKKSNKAKDEPDSLKWTWRPELIELTSVQGKGDVSVNSIVDQKDMANDASDYLWYMASVELGKDDLMLNETVTLRVTDTGHVLHVFIHGKYIGSRWAKYGNNVTNVFEKNMKLSPGRNLISLLSATVGFKNYEAKFDLVGAGVTSPVELVLKKGDETIVKDLSSNKWTYKIDQIPINKNFTWYKTTFKAPLGNKPVVDLLGLGKGMAWVNGHSPGRYWPSYIANKQLCKTNACDYRGRYSDKKCLSKCGEPTQRWYHVPRSFLNDGKRVELSCHNRPISKIEFASFGHPQGVCGSFEKGECESDVDVV